MALALIEFAAVGERAVIAAWKDFQRADGTRTVKGLELGRVLYEFRDKWKSKGGYGSKGKGLTGYLQDLGIPRGTSDYWILQYEYSAGLKQRPGIRTVCECGEEFPSRSQYRRHWRKEHMPDTSEGFGEPSTETATESEYKHRHKNRAIDQLTVLQKHFPGENIQIQRVGKGEMVDFEAWIKDIPASKVKGRGSDPVNVVMTYTQLRRVKGKVQVGARGSFDKAKRFLKLNT